MGLFLAGIGGGLLTPAFLASLLFTAYVSWCFLRLKMVHMGSDGLRVSTFTKTIDIPLTNIESVTGNPLLGDWPITIHLIAPCEFGSRIRFMPRQRFFIFGTHPVVDELLDAVQEAKNAPLLLPN